MNTLYNKYEEPNNNFNDSLEALAKAILVLNITEQERHNMIIALDNVVDLFHNATSK